MNYNDAAVVAEGPYSVTWINGRTVRYSTLQAAFGAVEGLCFVRGAQEADNSDIQLYFYTFAQPAARGPEQPFMATVRVDASADVEMARKRFDRIVRDMPQIRAYNGRVEQALQRRQETHNDTHD